jgi:hypothetical protein
MMSIENLLQRADAYKAATGLDADSTVSHRVFGDSKKLSALRAGADITVGRYRAAMVWFDENWPKPPPEASPDAPGPILADRAFGADGLPLEARPGAPYPNQEDAA